MKSKAMRPLIGSFLCMFFSACAFEVAKGPPEPQYCSTGTPLSEATDFEKISKNQLEPEFRKSTLIFVNSGETLVGVYSRECLKKAENLDYRNQIGISEEDLKRSSSTLISVAVEFSESLTESQLDSFLKSETCLVSLAERGEMELSNFGESNDPLTEQQEHHLPIESLEVFEQLVTQINFKRKAVVAVIDTGVQTDHTELVGRIWTNKGEIPNNQIDDDDNGYVDDVNGYNMADDEADVSPSSNIKPFDHGTHVSGLVGATYGNGTGGVGIGGPGLEIMVLNVFGSSTIVYPETLDEAIRYAVDNGADIINLSLGGNQRNQSTYLALEYAIQKGVLVVAAAGNFAQDQSQTTKYYPSAFAKDWYGMISVGSLDTESGDLSSFSNYSSDIVEIAAPGSSGETVVSEDTTVYNGLLSTLPGNSYGRKAGTSMAAPLVSGTIALMLQVSPSLLKGPQLEVLLTQSAPKSQILSSKIKEGRTLNTYKAVSEALAGVILDIPCN